MNMLEASSPPAIQRQCGPQHCVGCPAAARNVLEGLLGDSPESCSFTSLTLEPRAAFPSSILSRYSYAIVRRGYLIRQRTDAAGHTTSIDAVGPGCVFPVDHGAARTGESSISGYAVTRALVCVSDEDTLARGLAEGGPTAVQVHQLDSEAIARMERLADARGRPSAASKLAALLCALADTIRPIPNHAEPIPPEFQQRDLAGLLSIRHESVCRVMRDFERKGLIERREGGIALLDRERLQQL